MALLTSRPTPTTSRASPKQGTQDLVHKNDMYLWKLQSRARETFFFLFGGGWKIGHWVKSRAAPLSRIHRSVLVVSFLASAPDFFPRFASAYQTWWQSTAIIPMSVWIETGLLPFLKYFHAHNACMATLSILAAIWMQPTAMRSRGVIGPRGQRNFWPRCSPNSSRPVTVLQYTPPTQISRIGAYETQQRSVAAFQTREACAKRPIWLFTRIRSRKSQKSQSSTTLGPRFA